MNELAEQRKLKGITWSNLANGLPITGEGLRIAFTRGKVQLEYIPIIESNLNGFDKFSFNSEPEKEIDKDFYEWLQEEKLKKKFSYTHLGTIIGKSSDAMRQAVNRKSLSNLEKERIIETFTEQPKQEKPSVEEIRFEKIISQEVLKEIKPLLVELQQEQLKTQSLLEKLIQLQVK